MTYQAFENDIAQGKLQPVYVFTGPEEYGKSVAMERLKKALLPVGLEMLNHAVLENVTAAQIIDAAEAMPMMCERRIVEVRDWTPFFKADAASEAAAAHFLKWLDSPAPTCVVIFHLRTEPEKSNKNKKKTLQTTLSDKGMAVEFAYLSDTQLARWGGALAKSQGCSIDSDAMLQLTASVGKERTILASELDKLCAYVGKNGRITIEHVDALVTPSLEYAMYKLTDSMLNRNLQQAQTIVDSLILRGERYSIILSYLTRQMRILAHTRLAIDEKHVEETQKLLGISGYVGTITTAQAKRHPAKVFEELYAFCMQAQLQQRQGKLGERAAEQLAFMRIFNSFSQSAHHS